MRLGWQAGYPPAGKVVEVWYSVAIILAVWTGDEWRTADGQRRTIGPDTYAALYWATVIGWVSLG